MNSALQVQDEAQYSIDGLHLSRIDHSQTRCQAIDRDHAQLVTASEGSMPEPATRRLKFDMAPQTVTGGCHRDNDHQTARSIVEDVDRHHHRRTVKHRLVTDRLAEIDVIELPPPDQASASQS